jgi:hypothetical protein
MLKTILNSVSNSKNENEKKSISTVATLEKENFSVCEQCGSENFYLPIKSNRWECRECNPPKSDRFVAQSKQGRQIDETTQNDMYHPGWAIVDPAQCWGPYVLRSKNPVCKCGSEYFEETGIVCNVKKFCVCCREEIFCVDFV